MESVIDRVASGKADLLSVSDICKILKVTRSELLRWTRNSGKFSIKFPQPDIMIAGKRRWERPTLDAWMNADEFDGWSAIKGKYWPRFQ